MAQASGPQNFHPYFDGLAQLAVQAGFQVGLQLPQFARCGTISHQKAPCAFTHGPRHDLGPQRLGKNGFNNAHVPFGLFHQVAQVGQHGRAGHGFTQGERIAWQKWRGAHQAKGGIDMHLIITDPWLAKNRALHITGVQLVGALMAVVVALIAVSLFAYHFVFLHGARQGWPIVTPLATLVSSAERQSQERYLRENLDAMATKLGEMQARVVQLDALAERVAALAGVPATEAKSRHGAGGTLLSPRSLTMDELNASIEHLTLQALTSSDKLALAESQLFEDRVKKAMLPTEAPVRDSRLGSGFGWRIDPLTGQRALHTGLDFAADTGTPIVAAAGGVVVTQEFHPAYGNMVEIDHGKELVTRYAHASRVLVKVGDVVRRGQHIADVGSTGRSTGAHLHFEVWAAGVAQDPQGFLDAGRIKHLAGGTGKKLTPK